ncbi:unnamed protein product [Arctogadus glacialis]
MDEQVRKTTSLLKEMKDEMKDEMKEEMKVSGKVKEEEMKEGREEEGGVWGDEGGDVHRGVYHWATGREVLRLVRELFPFDPTL